MEPQTNTQKIVTLIEKIERNARVEGKRSVVKSTGVAKSDTMKLCDAVSKKLSKKIEDNNIVLKANDNETMEQLILRLKTNYLNEVLSVCASTKMPTMREFDKILYNCLVSYLSVSNKHKAMKPAPKPAEPQTVAPEIQV